MALTMREEPDDYKVKLLYLIGVKGREICETLCVGSTKEEVIAALDAFSDPKKNDTIERYNFFMQSQGQDECLFIYLLFYQVN